MSKSGKVACLVGDFEKMKFLIPIHKVMHPPLLPSIAMSTFGHPQSVWTYLMEASFHK